MCEFLAVSRIIVKIREIKITAKLNHQEKNVLMSTANKCIFFDFAVMIMMTNIRAGEKPYVAYVYEDFVGEYNDI